MANFSVEKFLRIYNDETGDYVEVREDRDSLGLVEIVQGTNVITMTTEQARHLPQTVTELCDFIDAREAKK
jgi:hypothetical protein